MSSPSTSAGNSSSRRLPPIALRPLPSRERLRPSHPSRDPHFLAFVAEQRSLPRARHYPTVTVPLMNQRFIFDLLMSDTPSRHPDLRRLQPPDVVRDNIFRMVGEIVQRLPPGRRPSPGPEPRSLVQGTPSPLAHRAGPSQGHSVGEFISAQTPTLPARPSGSVAAFPGTREPSIGPSSPVPPSPPVVGDGFCQLDADINFDVGEDQDFSGVTMEQPGLGDWSRSPTRHRTGSALPRTAPSSPTKGRKPNVGHPPGEPSCLNGRAAELVSYWDTLTLEQSLQNCSDYSWSAQRLEQGFRARQAGTVRQPDEMCKECTERDGWRVGCFRPGSSGKDCSECQVRGTKCVWLPPRSYSPTPSSVPSRLAGLPRASQQVRGVHGLPPGFQPYVPYQHPGAGPSRQPRRPRNASRPAQQVSNSVPPQSRDSPSAEVGREHGSGFTGPIRTGTTGRRSRARSLSVRPSAALGVPSRFAEGWQRQDGDGSEGMALGRNQSPAEGEMDID